MKIRKGLLATTLGGTVALATAFVPQASAQRVVVVRPYVGYRVFYDPRFVGRGGSIQDLPMLLVPPPVKSRSIRNPRPTPFMSTADTSARPTT